MLLIYNLTIQGYLIQVVVEKLQWSQSRAIFVGFDEIDCRWLDRDELATRIEQQRAKIRALELAAEERRRADELRIQEQAQKARSRRQESRQQRLLTAICTADRRVLSHQQDERASPE
jgi:hypothetical protein